MMESGVQIIITQCAATQLMKGDSTAENLLAIYQF